jgi:hypothetical protein
MLQGAIGASRRELAIRVPERAGYLEPNGASVRLPEDTRVRAVREITGRRSIGTGDHNGAVGGELRIGSTAGLGGTVRRGARREASP